jgi:HNH endonuclease
MNDARDRQRENCILGRRIYVKPEKKKRKNIRKITRDGYVVIGGRYEHRLVYELHYGAIPKGNIVHHIDCNPENNAPENLISLPNLFHNRLHYWMKLQGCIFDRHKILQLYEDDRKNYESVNAKYLEAKKNLKKAQKEVDRLAKALRGNWKDHQDNFEMQHAFMNELDLAVDRNLYGSHFAPDH